MSRRRRIPEDSSINLTPMIDVVFLLLIFFMVGSRFGDAEGRIEVSVPGVGELRSMTRVPDERMVEVTGDGMITLDNQAVNEQQLADQLRFAHSQYPDVKVAVRGDGQASFQRIAEVLQVIRSSGVKQMGIAARSTRR
ncbi:MAG: ExbD/TolR family protein [Planctomycetaceae bacterium]